MTLISSPKLNTARAASSRVLKPYTLIARKLGDIAYVVEMNALPGPYGQILGTVTIGKLTEDGFIGREAHPGAICFREDRRELKVRDPHTGYVLLHIVGIEEVTEAS